MEQRLLWLRSAAREASHRLCRYLPDTNAEAQLRPGVTVHILGAAYAVAAVGTGDSELLAALRQCIWFSYRCGFEPIPGTSFTTDAGWGCMMRSGQMILAQAILVSGVMLPPKIAAPLASLASPASTECASHAEIRMAEDATAREAALLALFADTVDAPFSIQQIASFEHHHKKATSTRKQNPLSPGHLPSVLSVSIDPPPKATCSWCCCIRPNSHPLTPSALSTPAKCRPRPFHTCVTGA